MNIKNRIGLSLLLLLVIIPFVLLILLCPTFGLMVLGIVTGVSLYIILGALAFKLMESD